MAGYTTAIPPRLLSPGLGSAAKQVWEYNTADTDTTVKTAGYFTNGDKLGMKVGDIVYVYVTSVPGVYIHFVQTVNAGGSADLNQTPAALT